LAPSPVLTTKEAKAILLRRFCTMIPLEEKSPSGLVSWDQFEMRLCISIFSKSTKFPFE